MKVKQCSLAMSTNKNARDPLMTINKLTPGLNLSVLSLMIKFRHHHKKNVNLVDSQYFKSSLQSYGVVFSSTGGENGVNLKPDKKSCTESWHK